MRRPHDARRIGGARRKPRYRAIGGLSRCSRCGCRRPPWTRTQCAAATAGRSGLVVSTAHPATRRSSRTSGLGRFNCHERDRTQARTTSTDRAHRSSRAASVLGLTALPRGDDHVLPAHLYLGEPRDGCNRWSDHLDRCTRSRWIARRLGRRPGRRRTACRRGLRHHFSTPDPDSLLASLSARGSRLHGAGRVRDRSRDGANRPRGPLVRRAALLVCLRGPRNHGHPHDPLSARPPRHDPRRTPHDLLGPVAGLCPLDQRLRPGTLGLGPHRSAGTRSTRALPGRSGGGTRRGRDPQTNADSERRSAFRHGVADLSLADGQGLVFPGLRERLGLHPTRGHDHPRRIDHPVGSVELSEGRGPSGPG